MNNLRIYREEERAEFESDSYLPKSLEADAVQGVEPLVRGGQGRSAASVVEGAAGIVFLAACGFGGVLLALWVGGSL